MTTVRKISVATGVLLLCIVLYQVLTSKQAQGPISLEVVPRGNDLGVSDYRSESAPSYESALSSETPESEILVAVEGTVVDDSGRPVTQATVWAERATKNGIPSAEDSDTVPPESASMTDAEGSFQLIDLAANSPYRLCGRAEGYQCGSVDVTVAEKAVENVILTLKRGCIVDGRVIKTDGTPVAYAVVIANSGDIVAPEGTYLERDGNSLVVKKYSNTPPTSTTAGLTGEFHFGHLEPGSCTFSVEIRNADGGRARITKNADGEILRKLDLRAGESVKDVDLVISTLQEYTICGTISAVSGGPIPDARVWASRRPSEEAIKGLFKTRSAKDGSFCIEAVALEPWEAEWPVCVNCEAQGYEPAVVEGVPLGTIDLEIGLVPLRRGGLRGIVLEHRTRKPIEGASISLFQVYSAWGGRWRPPLDQRSEMSRKYSDTTDAAGRFAIDDVQEGAATVQVYRDGYGLSLHGPFDVKSEQSSDAQILLLPPGFLEVCLIPAGDLAEPEAQSWVELAPTAVLNESDDSSWAYPYARFSGVKLPSYPAMTASARFKMGYARESGQKLPYEATGPRTYRFALQPGEYQIRASMERAVSRFSDPQDAGMTSPKVYRETSATVSSGLSTTVDLEMGGTARVEGSVAVNENEDRAFLVLTPGTATDSLRNLQEPVGWGVVPELVHAYGQVMCSTAVSEDHGYPYAFRSVPPGTYTLSVYVRTAGLQNTYLRAAPVIELHAEETAKVDIR